ncbi:hypothetical protein JYK17_17350 [Streptomyces sp. KC 17012]|uniref:hypothetical protein n=1 Tax=Streptomyces plumbidurans TaxID=2814589 RepID=UPI001C9DD757|nr:hypothetical protein [Streptomyces plumbidurans]MBY8341798.1 hypothetical protein [Streptomyces plumbidurans]
MSETQNDGMGSIVPGTDVAVAEWLLTAAHDLGEATEDWRKCGIAVLDCGLAFSVLTIPAPTIYAAAHTSEADGVARYLASALGGGPAFVSTDGDSYYVLVPPDVEQETLPPGVQCLGRSALLSVPRPDLTDPSQHAHASYWAVPMAGPGALCPTGAAIQVATAGRYRQTQQGEDQ